MQYNIHNYVSEEYKDLTNELLCFYTLEWAIYNYIYRGSPHMEVAIMFLQKPLMDKLLYRACIVTMCSREKTLTQWWTSNSNIRNDIVIE